MLKLNFIWGSPDATLTAQILEKAYQQTNNLDKLSLLYLAVGSAEKYPKMRNFANVRGDLMSWFHNALYGDVKVRLRS